MIISYVIIYLTINNESHSQKVRVIRRVLHMAYAFAFGTIIIYAFVMKHVLKNVTH